MNFQALIEHDGSYLPAFDGGALPRVSTRAQGVQALRIAGVTLRLTKREPFAPEQPALYLSESTETIPPGTHRLELLGPGRSVLYTWTVIWDRPPSERAEVRAVKALVDAGRDEEALARAEASMDPYACAAATSIHRARGLRERAAENLLRCADLALAAKIPSEYSRWLRAAAHYFKEARQYRRALELLEKCELHDRRINFRLGLARTIYHRGDLAREVGDLRSARIFLAEAIVLNQLAGDDRTITATRSTLALALFDLGLHEQAEAELRAAIAAAKKLRLPGDDEGTLRLNLAWILLEGRCAKDASQCSPEIVESFRYARDLSLSVSDPRNAAIATLNLAFAHFRMRNFREARAALSSIERAHLESQAPHALLLEVDLAIAEGDPRSATRSALELVELAELGLEAELVWRARAALGRALRASGKHERAAASFDRALDLLEHAERATPIGGGRATFVADRRGAYLDAIDANLRLGRTERALARADRAASRLFRSFDRSSRRSNLPPAERERFLGAVERYLRERDQFEAKLASSARSPANERANAAAELARDHTRLLELLDAAFFELDRGARDDQPLDLVALSAQLEPGALLMLVPPLGPATFRAFLWDGRKLRVFLEKGELIDALARAHGTKYFYRVDPAETIELDELAIGGRPLRTVLATSDLPYAGLLLRARARTSTQAVIVADSAGDLPLARGEGVAIADKFAARSLLGTAATRGAVLSALSSPLQLFHFAGHGILSASDPWSAHLVLAPPDRLTVDDIFTLRAAPGLVVLSGCETGRAQALAPGETLGLSTAFLAGGAETVVALDDRIDDEAAKALMFALYTEGLREEPAEAVRRVAERHHTRGDESWRSIRVFGRARSWVLDQER